MKTSKIIHQQWLAMLDYGKIPLFEIEIRDNEFLVVDLEYTEKGISFEFYQQGKVYFDGAIKGNNGLYTLHFDDCFIHLDYYLQSIYDNITEGYLIPNNLLMEHEE